MSDNPLLEPWTGPFGLPPFDRIRPEHFPPAFDRAMADHAAEVDAIARNPAAPTFAKRGVSEWADVRRVAGWRANSLAYVQVLFVCAALPKFRRRSLAAVLT